MTLSDVWSLVIVKLPLILVALAVWWAIHEEPDESASASDDDGGLRVSARCERPRRPWPGPTRRGPHAGPSPAAPPRVRTARARSRRAAR